MTMLARVSWLELKLFFREPLTVLFALALPLLILLVNGGVFGNDVDADFFRGVGAMDYYLPAFVALIAASVGLITLPAHIAGNRERGVLKRYHASSMPVRILVGSQIVVALVVASLSVIVLIAAAVPIYGVAAPDSLLTVLAGFILVASAFTALGVLLGAVLPTARAALALGVMLWFTILMLGGAGPPPEVLSGPMSTVSQLTPLRHAVWVMHDGWLSLDAGISWLIVGLFLAGSVTLALRFFRIE